MRRPRTSPRRPPRPRRASDEDQESGVRNEGAFPMIPDSRLPTPDSRDVLVGLYLYASRMPGVTNHRYFRGPHYVKTSPAIHVASTPSLAWQSEEGSNSKRVDDHSGEADLDGRGESVAHSAVCKCASVLGCATIIRTIAIGRAPGPFVWSASIYK
jgi:hypothetical protein